MSITILAWAYKGALTSMLSVNRPLPPFGKFLCFMEFVFYPILFFPDTLEDFANSPYKIGGHSLDTWTTNALNEGLNDYHRYLF